MNGSHGPLCFLYHGKMSTDDQYNMKMLQIANRYKVKGLKDMCQSYVSVKDCEQF